MSEEQAKWLAMIEDLQGWNITLAQIAEHLNVSERQVSNWKTGDRPKGMTAVKLYLFHGKHRTLVHGTSVHGAEEAKTA